MCGKSEGIREAFGGHSEAFGGVRGAFGILERFFALRFVGSQETDPGWTYPLYNINLIKHSKKVERGGG